MAWNSNLDGIRDNELHTIWKYLKGREMWICVVDSTVMVAALYSGGIDCNWTL